MVAIDVKRPPITTPRTDLITMLFGTWLMVGIFLDGYAHTNLIDELESFFTPWHAVFYSGFLATTSWVVWIIYSNIRSGLSWREAIPQGYGPTVFGLALFALGGVGDGIWHTIFGIEQGVDALLSPTHFMLFVGGFLGLSTVIRTARVRNPDAVLATGERGPLLLSLLLVTGAMAFFTVYVWIPAQIRAMGIPYEDAQGAVGYVIAGALVATTIMIVPALIVLRWWDLPGGLLVVIWPVVNTAIAVAFTMDLITALAFGLSGGIAGELARSSLSPGPRRRFASMTTLAVAVVVGWTGCLVAFALTDQILWPPEVWSGLVVMSGLATLGLSWVALPHNTRVENLARS